MQTEMSTLSSNSRLWIAEQSDHGVPLRQPDIVVDAITELVQRYRSSAGRTPDHIAIHDSLGAVRTAGKLR